MAAIFDFFNILNIYDHHMIPEDKILFLAKFWNILLKIVENSYFWNF